MIAKLDQRSAVVARGRTPRLSRYRSNLIGLASASAKPMYPSGRTKYTAPRFTPAWSILGRHGNVWQGTPLPLADLLELRCGFAINVHLPIERGQRGEVVGPV